MLADGGYGGDRLKELQLPEIPEIAGFTVIPRRGVVARTFAGTGQCRRLAGEFERSPESSPVRSESSAPPLFLMRRVA